jgi:hypothetical protein
MDAELLAFRVDAVERARALALRVSGAPEEAPEAVPTHQHRPAALLADLALGREDLLDDLVGVGLARLERSRKPG